MLLFRRKVRQEREPWEFSFASLAKTVEGRVEESIRPIRYSAFGFAPRLRRKAASLK
jgi:hypothetical protein